MKIYEIVQRCKDVIFGADFSEDIALTAEQKNDETQSDAPTKRSTDTLLVTCCNLVLEELYCDYATAIKKTVIEVVDGFAKIDGLQLSRVISVKDDNGYDVKYRYSENGLQIDRDGTYNLTYARLPETVAENDDLLLPSPRITPRIFIYGVLKEYFFATNDAVCANTWEERYKDALQIANVKQSSMRMPQRRWIS